MKPLIVLLAIFLCLSSASAVAQQKADVVKSLKEKPAKTEKTFSIIEKGVLLTKATFRREGKASANVIEIEALNVSGGSISLGNYSSGASAILPPANISDISQITGSYSSTRDVSKSGRGVVMQLLDVNYPFRARMIISEQILEFEITEPGFWKISVSVSQ